MICALTFFMAQVKDVGTWLPENLCRHPELLQTPYANCVEIKKEMSVKMGIIK